MNRLMVGVVALGVLCAAGRAEAGATYEFSFTYSGTIDGQTVSGSGDLYGTETSPGVFALTSGSGTSTEAGALTLEPAGTYKNTLSPTVNLTSDNLLSPTSTTILNGDGIVFYAADAPVDSKYINIFGDGGGNYTYFNNYSGPFPAVNGPVTFSVTELGTVPEPASIVSATLGVLCVGGFALARKRKIASV